MSNKQELEKAKVIVESYLYGESYHCPSCDKHLGYDYDKHEDVNFCSKCGQPLKWED